MLRESARFWMEKVLALPSWLGVQIAPQAKIKARLRLAIGGYKLPPRPRRWQRLCLERSRYNAQGRDLPEELTRAGVPAAGRWESIRRLSSFASRRCY